MNMKTSLVLLLLILPWPLAAQEQQAVSIDQEPHHHLVFQNEYVEVHQILLPPGDGFKLHRHDQDEISVVITGGESIGHTPGKPDRQGRSTSGRIGFGRSPRVHSSHNIGNTTIHNVAVSLLHPQGEVRNLCKKQIEDQPLNCPAELTANANAPYIAEPQFETDQTRAVLTVVRPGQSAPIGEADREQLVIAIDEVVIASTEGSGSGKMLHPGDFVWINRGDPPRVLKNTSDKQARFATLAFKPI
jgi:quercetin dioxygenase-like cupin family protein